METKSEKFKKAHQIARTLEGDYRARFSFALKVVYGSEKLKEDHPMKERLISMGVSEEVISQLSLIPCEGILWSNYGKVRLYFERHGSKGYLDLLHSIYYADKDRTYNWKFMHQLMHKTNFKY